MSKANRVQLRSLTNASSSSTASSPSTRRRAGNVSSLRSIDPQAARFDRKDPYTAFNTLRKLVEALPSTGHNGKAVASGRGQFKISGEERELALELMSIVEPFIGLAPSRRTLTRLPNEILDKITGHIFSKRDLLSLALVCKRLYDVVFPRHYSYRDIRCRLSALVVWHHFAVHRDLARNVRRLEILDERSSGGKALLPEGIAGTDTDMESSDDERRINVHGKQERMFLAALARMTSLTDFVWSCNHSLVPLVNVWPTLLRSCFNLQVVEINDNLVFSSSQQSLRLLMDGFSKGLSSGSCDESGLSNVTTVTVKTSKRGLGYCKDPDLTQVTEMLSHCSGIESLDIQLAQHRQLPARADNFFRYGRWPNLRSLSLTKLSCTPQAYPFLSDFLAAHNNLEVLDLDIGPAASHLTLPIDTLPRLRELRSSKEFARSVMGCPTTDAVRPLEALRGVSLSGQISDQAFFEELKKYKLKRLELTSYTEFEDIRRLVECIPHVTWLDIGKKVNALYKNSELTTNVIDWAELLSNLPQLTAFHGVRFFYVSGAPGEESARASASASYRSKYKRNDEVASMLYWKCPKLRRVDCWDSGEEESLHTAASGVKKIIVLSKDGERIRWDVKKAKL